MLGISEENILEHVEGTDQATGDDLERAVTIGYNQTDPHIIRDGIDRVTVIEETDDRYLVDYWGYMMGYLRVTREGVAELGASLLGDQAEIPNWIVEPLPAGDAPPWWIPDDYDAERAVPCHRCGRDTPVGEIVTPGGFEGGSEDHFCRGCWGEIRDRWHPDEGIKDLPAAEQAEALREEAARDPGGVDVDAISESVRADEPDAQWQALEALADVIDARPSDALDHLPAMTLRLRSDDRRVRSAALACLAALADEFPRQAAPATEDVIGMLDPDAEEEVLDSAISYVAAVADADPGAVVDATPKLAAILQTDTPREQGVLVALTRIAGSYPESVLPVVDGLLAYVETEDADNRVAAFAALGHVAKAYPNVAESAIPTLIELLDDDSDYLRANAGGLLAELADEYPDAVLPAAQRVIELLDDGDEKARYNATSILARLAKVEPDALEGAVEPLIDTLDEEFAYSRSNACWALGRLEARVAREALETANESDPNEEVRSAAGWALDQLG